MHYSMVISLVLVMIPGLTFLVVVAHCVLATPHSLSTPYDLYALPNIRRCGEKFAKMTETSTTGKGALLVTPQLNLTYRANKGLQKSAWPKAYGNLENTGRSASIGDNTGNLLWKYRVNQLSYVPKTQFLASPILDSQGNVLIGMSKQLTINLIISCCFILYIQLFQAGGDDGVFYAISKSGSLVWSYKSDGQILNTAALAEDGTIYFGTFFGTMYALNSFGKLLWAYRKSGSHIVSSATIGTDGTIYFGAGDVSDFVGPNSTGSLYALNPWDGSVKWRYSTPAPILYTSPAIGSDGMVYIGCYDTHLHAVSASGLLVWKFKTAGYVMSAPVLTIVKNVTTVYICALKAVYAISQDGTLRWTYATGDYISSSPAVGTNGAIFVTSQDNAVYALHPVTGALQWQFQSYHPIYTTPSVGGDNTLYFGSTDAFFYAVNGTDGLLLWRRATQGAMQIRAPAAIDYDGTVYIGLLSGFIIAYHSSMPTAQPTSAPSTMYPTMSPTSEPPTLYPTMAPSPLPTKSTTRKPSQAPSSIPLCIPNSVCVMVNNKSNENTLLLIKCGNCTRGTYELPLDKSYCAVCIKGTIAPSAGATSCTPCNYPRTTFSGDSIQNIMQYSNNGFQSDVDIMLLSEQRIECNAVDMAISLKVLYGSYAIITATLMSAFLCIYLRISISVDLTGAEKTKNIIYGILVLVPTIELLAYLNYIGRVIVENKIFCLIWIFFLLHSMCFLLLFMGLVKNEYLKDEKNSENAMTVVPKSGWGRRIFGKKVIEFKIEKRRRTLSLSDCRDFDEVRENECETVINEEERTINKVITKCNLNPESSDNLKQLTEIEMEVEKLKEDDDAPLPHTIINNNGSNNVPTTNHTIKHTPTREGGWNKRAIFPILRDILTPREKKNSVSLKVSLPKIHCTILTALETPNSNLNSRIRSMDFLFNFFRDKIFWLGCDGWHATVRGNRLPISPRKHRTMLLFSIEALIWCIAILLQIATILLCPFLPILLPLFYPFWILFGIILSLFRLLPFCCVWDMYTHTWMIMIPTSIAKGASISPGNDIQYNCTGSNGPSMNSKRMRPSSGEMTQRDSRPTSDIIRIQTMWISGISGITFQTVPMLVLIITNCYLTGERSYCSILAIAAGSLSFLSFSICWIVHYEMQRTSIHPLHNPSDADTKYVIPGNDCSDDALDVGQKNSP